MRYTQFSVLITALFLCFLSCRETIGERHKSLPKENAAPPSQQIKIENTVQKDTAAEQLKTPQDKEIKKKKKKASDTLRPMVAVLFYRIP